MISIVVPVFNEKENLPELYERIACVVERWHDGYEVIVVDDGSDVETQRLLNAIHEADPNWRVIRFSRNFGHQTAVSAGIYFSRGDAVAVMDGDLQDPPELLNRMLDCLRSGYHVVYAVRRSRREHLFKRVAYKLFYRILARTAAIDIPLDSGDFCLMDRVVVNVLNSLPERSRFVRGLRSWTGFRQVGIEYDRSERFAGAPKYSFAKLCSLAVDGIVSFSDRPLRFASWLGSSLCAMAAVMIVLVAFWWWSDRVFLGSHPRESVGWTSLVCLMFFFFGVQTLLIGIVGEYLARVYTEVKNRPAWIVSEALGFEDEDYTPTVGWFVGADRQRQQSLRAHHSVGQYRESF